jgi:hypothetical protein
MLPFALMLLASCATTPPTRTETVEVKVPVYVALPSALTTGAPIPAFPATLTNAAWLQYTLDLQTALKIDDDKLIKVQALQPMP